MAFLALVFGALTANVAGANTSCRGFPWCTSIEVHGMPLSIQIVHRVLAFVLLFHTFGMMMAARKRGEPVRIQRTIRYAFNVILAQIILAATMVSLHLPAVWRSLHQAMGTLVWLAIFTLAALTHYAMVGWRGEGMGGGGGDRLEQRPGRSPAMQQAVATGAHPLTPPAAQ